MNLVVYNCFFFSYSLLFILSVLMLPVAIILLWSDKTYILYWRIFQINNRVVDITFIFDRFGVLTSIVVIFISSNVLRFAITYMAYDKFVLRFNILVLLFVLSINLLIFIPNIIMLLLGWDGLGLTRFLLVIYYQNSKSLGAGIITALTNRLGDAILLLAISWSLNINNWLITNIWDSWCRLFIVISVILAGITKSAQIPFSSWLPAAIAAPTPVSALVHRSTLVTAGVFLLVRFYEYVRSIKIFERLLLIVACLTIVIAAFCAIVECDLKKIIALSTLRQLSVIIVSLSIGLPKLALFHLITHALFKALLFVCAGRFIFLHFHNQDLRIVGNLSSQLPLTSVCFIIGRVSLCGLPFLSGFYSKDLILEVILSGVRRSFMLIIVMIATGGTALYRIRLVVIGITNNRLSSSYHRLSNEDKRILLPIVNLTIGAIFGGRIISWLLGPFDVECFLSIRVKLLPLYLTVLGGVIIFIVGIVLTKEKSFILGVPIVHDRFCSIWFFVPLSSQFRLYFFKPAYYYLRIIDHGWVENISAQGAYTNFNSIRVFIQPVQSKFIRVIMSLSIIFLFIVVVYF